MDYNVSMDAKKADCSYFSNVDCEYYPCHGMENQNCLFCYCPLYLVADCGGNFSAAGGARDCSSCRIVHDEGGWEYVQKKLGETVFAKTPPRFFSLSMPAWLGDFLSRSRHDFSTKEGRMAFAIALSEENVRQGTGGPFGAAVFARDTGELVACGVNRVEPERISVAHAEVMALSLAQEKIGNFDLGEAGLELATSSQPCTMCFGATIWSGVHSVLVGARREDVETIAGFDEGPEPADWKEEFARRGIAVSTDILRKQACDVLKRYRDSGATIYNSSANKLR
jgi:tRNA(Arg) A34 adenosine deaminase TadA/Zn-finger protein